jgi:hypothetical protein
MMSLTNITGLAGVALVMAAACLLLPGASRLPCKRLAWLMVAVFVAVLIPVHGLPLAAYVRGATGDLSITTLVLLLGAIWRQLAGRPAAIGSVNLLAIVLAALALYPMALGWGGFDPYRLGFGDPWFLSGLLILALGAIWLKLPGMTAAIALAVLAWGAGWYESGNLWDYLLDPLVSIYAAGALVKRVFLRLYSCRVAKTV